MFADLFLTIVNVIVTLIIGAFIIYSLMPRTKYISTRSGVRKESEKPPPLDN